MFENKRNPRRLKWTKAYRRTHNKELSMDTTFDFEKQRNRPPKYDREMYAETLRAMKRVSEIQERRQRTFYFKRMTDAVRQRKAHIRLNLVKGAHLVLHPLAAKQKALLDQEQLQEVSVSAEQVKLQNQLTAQPQGARKQTAKKKQQQQRAEREDMHQVENDGDE